MNSLLKQRFIFFGGKGGVGKTSFAAALGIFAADRGINTLIISTDPAHSLADCFDQRIGNDYVPIKGVENLFGFELDSNKAVAEYEDILQFSDDSGMMKTVLGDSEIHELTPPGTDETIAFIKVLEYIESPSHDLLIFDTAPTGHTLRLLSLPSLMDTWAYKMIVLRKKLGGMMAGVKSLFGGKKQKETDITEITEDLRKKIQAARVHLENPDETEFIPVTIPTLMAFYETERLIDALIEYKMPSQRIIINQINPSSTTCKFCKKRFEQHQDNIAHMKELYSDEFSIAEFFMADYEIRGIENLRSLGKQIFNDWV